MNSLSTAALPTPIALATGLDLELALANLVREIHYTKVLTDSAECAWEDLLSHLMLTNGEAVALGDRIDGLFALARRNAAAAIVQGDSLIDRLPEVSQPSTSVGRHVDIQRRRAFRAAVDAYDDAEADQFDPAVNDDAALGHAAAAAFQAMVATRAPDLRSLHEKLTIVGKADAWTADNVTSAIFADVEALARRYECDGQLVAAEPAQPPASSWNDLMARYLAAKAEEDEYERVIWGPANDREKAFTASPLYSELSEVGRANLREAHPDQFMPDQVDYEINRLQGIRCDLQSELLGVDAPDNAALKWKLEILLGDRDAICWGDNTVDPLMADVRRLLGGDV